MDFQSVYKNITKQNLKEIDDNCQSSKGFECLSFLQPRTEVRVLEHIQGVYLKQILNVSGYDIGLSLDNQIFIFSDQNQQRSKSTLEKNLAFQNEINNKINTQQRRSSILESQNNNIVNLQANKNTKIYMTNLSKQEILLVVNNNSIFCINLQQFFIVKLNLNLDQNDQINSLYQIYDCKDNNEQDQTIYFEVNNNQIYQLRIKADDFSLVNKTVAFESKQNKFIKSQIFLHQNELLALIYYQDKIDIYQIKQDSLINKSQELYIKLFQNKIKQVSFQQNEQLTKAILLYQSQQLIQILVYTNQYIYFLILYQDQQVQLKKINIILNPNNKYYFTSLMYFEISLNNIKIKYYFCDQMYLDYYDSFGLDDLILINNNNNNKFTIQLGRQFMEISLINQEKDLQYFLIQENFSELMELTQLDLQTKQNIKQIQIQRTIQQGQIQSAIQLTEYSSTNMLLISQAILEKNEPNCIVQLYQYLFNVYKIQQDYDQKKHFVFLLSEIIITQYNQYLDLQLEFEQNFVLFLNDLKNEDLAIIEQLLIKNDQTYELILIYIETTQQYEKITLMIIQTLQEEKKSGKIEKLLKELFNSTNKKQANLINFMNQICNQLFQYGLLFFQLFPELIIFIIQQQYSLQNLSFLTKDFIQKTLYFLVEFEENSEHINIILKHLRELINQLSLPENLNNQSRKIIGDLSEILFQIYIRVQLYEEVNILMMLFDTDIGLFKHFQKFCYLIPYQLPYTEATNDILINYEGVNKNYERAVRIALENPQTENLAIFWASQSKHSNQPWLLIAANFIQISEQKLFDLLNEPKCPLIIQDVLNLFDDNSKLELFKEVIQKDDRKSKIDLYKDQYEWILLKKNQINEKFTVLQPEMKCDFCSICIGNETCLAFNCDHLFHLNCLKDQLERYGQSEKIKEINRLEKEQQQSIDHKEQIQQQIESLYQQECPYCGPEIIEWAFEQYPESKKIFI